MKIYYPMRPQTILITGLAIFLLIFCSCQKEVNSIVNNAPLLDSVIYYNGFDDSVRLHFVYDGQDRVIEERISYKDTLRTRRVYAYNGNDPWPYQMTGYSNGDLVNPESKSFYQYNSSGRKIYDSTWAMPGSVYTGYKVSHFDYSTPSRLFISSSISPAYFQEKDTLVFNTTGNIDSMYGKASYTPGVWTGDNVWKFSLYETGENPLHNLSTAGARSFESIPGGSIYYFTGMSRLSLSDEVMDYFALNNFGSIVYQDRLHPSNSNTQQFQNFYDNNGQLVKQVIHSSYSNGTYNYTSAFRFVYR